LSSSKLTDVFGGFGAICDDIIALSVYRYMASKQANEVGLTFSHGPSAFKVDKIYLFIGPICVIQRDNSQRALLRIRTTL